MPQARLRMLPAWLSALIPLPLLVARLDVPRSRPPSLPLLLVRFRWSWAPSNRVVRAEGAVASPSGGEVRAGLMAAIHDRIVAATTAASMDTSSGNAQIVDESTP